MSFNALLNCCLVVAVVSLTSSASDRRLDKLVFEGTMYSTNACVMEEYWNSVGTRPRLKEVDSYIGEYEAEFSIEDEKLLLKKFKATRATDKMPLTVRDLFKDKDQVVADWYTGTVLMIPGENGTGSFRYRYPIVHCLLIESGNVVKISKLENEVFDLPGRIGVSLEKSSGRVTITSLARNSPASKCGLIDVGDEIIFVSSEDWGRHATDDLSIRDLCGYIEGRNGTKITIGLVKKNTGKQIEIALTRN